MLMRFGILGPVLADGEVGGPRPRALLALLLLEAGRVVSTGRLSEALYGDEPPGANALQAQVSRLRRRLGVPIERQPAGYRLVVDPDDVDVHRFARLAGAGRQALHTGEHAEAARLLREALLLWRGPALADVEAPFAEGQAVRLAEERATAIEDLAEAELALGEAEVAPELRELATAQPLRERTQSLLVRALSKSGRQAEALAVFEGTRRRLADELGADPSAELAEAHLVALRAEPLRTTAAPAQLTSFVGREDELNRVAHLLTGSRLVTLTGTGGAGKTRLAIEVTGPGACFADLAPADGGAVPQVVLDALGLREKRLFGMAAEADPVRRIVSALADRELLLVLDNCEHVIDEAAALVHRLLAGCPGLRVLATSREPLGITGEALCPVPPLAEETALRLFADRAVAVSPEFTMDTDVVRRICAAVDRLPLAIELAAARLRTLPLPQLETRLADRFRLLSRGSRTAAPRHQTLGAVVTWSWDLLTLEEQQLLRRLSVFPGGATVTSASVVCGLSEVAADELLTGLADKSLVEVHGDRFRMLDTIRAYAAERLAEAGERDAISRAHAEFFLDLARTADPHLRRTEQLTWLARLTAEHANLHAALRWAVSADVELALRLVGAQTAYWRLRGVLSENIPLAARLLDELGPRTPPGLEEEYVLTVLSAGPSEVDRQRAETIMHTLDWPLRQPQLLIGWAMFAGPPRPDEPPTPMQRRLGTVDDPWLRALWHFSQSYLRLFNGQIDEAGPDLRAALAGFRQVGDRWGISQTLDGLATHADLTGDWARAVELTDEAIVLLEELGALEDLAELWARRGDRLCHGGKLTDAEVAYDHAVELARRSGVPAILAATYLGRGTLAMRRGEVAEARRWHESALETCGTDWLSAGTRSRVLTALGRVTGDGSRHDAAVRSALGQQFDIDVAEATEGLAEFVARGDPGQAAYLLGLAEALRGRPRTGDPALTRLREQLGDSPDFARGKAKSAAAARDCLRTYRGESC
ncbi:BTAD domain-containing putative transcriptional regulator [Amycolatopsis pithecellobii]|uniref:AfsR/SARP family transcriptional regulator n=1 Tax=Amycolatopsis pithecellobii TaxID=664692 RepID=A0A6N7YIU5_9PSEU|nr:BTAD domain-containing putative transcriptional regulator [Amycolatopsis pithecellobii]MTD52827.1 AfsR/SARP family transcriptional regulator [Amycolatopsis pithecellobii]